VVVTVVSTQSDSHARGRENNLLLDASPRNINQGVHARWKTPLNRGVNARTSFHYGIAVPSTGSMYPPLPADAGVCVRHCLCALPSAVCARSSSVLSVQSNGEVFCDHVIVCKENDEVHLKLHSKAFGYSGTTTEQTRKHHIHG